MSAQLQTNLMPDVQRVLKTQERTIVMLTMMHSALREIADGNDRERGGMTAQAIAADCLMEIHDIAQEVDCA